jgi:hypothetical protein
VKHPVTPTRAFLESLYKQGQDAAGSATPVFGTDIAIVCAYALRLMDGDPALVPWSTYNRTAGPIAEAANKLDALEDLMADLGHRAILAYLRQVSAPLHRARMELEAAAQPTASAEATSDPDFEVKP